LKHFFSLYIYFCLSAGRTKTAQRGDWYEG
jgi:hypothetical protein